MMSGVFGAMEQSETSSYASLLYIGVVLFMCFLILNKSLVADINKAVTAVTVTTKPESVALSGCLFNEVHRHL